MRLAKCLSVFRWRLSKRPPKCTIEPGTRLESRVVADLTDARIRVKQSNARIFRSDTPNVLRKSQAGAGFSATELIALLTPRTSAVWCSFVKEQFFCLVKADGHTAWSLAMLFCIF